MRDLFAKSFIRSCRSSPGPMELQQTYPLPSRPSRPPHSNGHSASNGSIHHVAEPQRAAVVAAESNGAPPVTTVATGVQIAPPPPSVTAAPNGEPARAPTLATETMTPSEHEYIAFCQRVNPLGDMRRVVVAAEAAHRYLNIASVDPDSLAHLFMLAGWPIPHSFVQDAAQRRPHQVPVVGANTRSVRPLQGDQHRAQHCPRRGRGQDRSRIIGPGLV